MTGRRGRFVVDFASADPSQVSLLGGKGAGLARMVAAGLPVPDGFIISTEAYRTYRAEGTIPESLWNEVLEHLTALAQRTGRTFGGGPLPLLVSVRSGAPVSMPGMMDTILNLGLNEDAAVALATATGDVRFVADVLRRFHRMYAEIVLGALGDVIDELVTPVVEETTGDEEPSAMFRRVWSACAAAVEQEVGDVVPASPHEQLRGAIAAVLQSWDNRRAVTYREYHDIPHDLGTAVVVQSMVFGNLGTPSGTGVAFTRDPLTGEPRLYGEFLESGQGEDVVAGVVDPEPLEQVAERMPAVFDELRRIAGLLEREHADVLDIEFTVEQGTLYLLQVRRAKRTAAAAVRIAADLLTEGMIGVTQALRSVTTEHVRHVERPRFDEEALSAAIRDGRLLATGIGASPGQAGGLLVTDPDIAVERAERGDDVVLVRPTTSPQDLHGMLAAKAIITVKGGATSHAAVVARAVGKPCVVACSAFTVTPDGAVRCGSRTLPAGTELSVDGSTGQVVLGGLPMTRPAASNDALAVLLREADRLAGCHVYGRVSTAEQVTAVLARGATGVVTSIGDVLAASGDLEVVLDVIEGGDEPDLLPVRESVAARLTPLLRAANGRPVGVRTIDFLADEARELLQQTDLLTRHPQLSLPLGFPPLLVAQLQGVEDAATAAGAPDVHVAVRHVCDERETSLLRELQRDAVDAGRVGVGAYLTSPRGALGARTLVAGTQVLWLEVRHLQATVFGLPARHLLTAQPLDDYLQRGLLPIDPRTAIDPSLDHLVDAVATAADAAEGCRVGMRLSGPVSEEIAADLHRRGVRTFAVDAAEVRAARLALGKAALDT